MDPLLVAVKKERKEEDTKCSPDELQAFAEVNVDVGKFRTAASSIPSFLGSAPH